jgi:hypothetical protein
MPDQHAAATEHELLSTITEPLGQLPEDPLAVLAADFPVALRGYDRLAVDAYVERTTQVVAELQSTRSPEAAVRRALQRVGEEISGILQRAHDTADEITARSRSEADARLETARREALELTAEAERRVAELDAETDRIWAERHSIVTDVRALASRLTGLAETALERFPAAVAPEPVPAPPPSSHPFDGAGALLDSAPALVEDEPTVEQSPADEAEPWISVEPGLEPPVALEAPVALEPLFPPTVTEDAEAEGQSYDTPVAEPDHLAHEPVAPGGRDDPAPEPHSSAVDQPTVDMPPIEPWEGEEPGPFDAGQS